MLKFILGTSGSGKTEYIKNEIKDFTDKEILVIVPEQISFDTEQSFLYDLGEKHLSYTKVLSFTALARLVFNEYGGVAGEYADETAKLILMNRAVKSISDKLDFYSGSKHKSDFAVYCLQAVNEFKNAGISILDLQEKSFKIPDANLKLKTSELLLIYSVYDELLYSAYNDPLDDISRAVKLIEGKRFFQNYNIYIDGFCSFTNPQIKLIEHMCEAESLTVCLTYDDDINNTLFLESQSTYKTLKNLARKANIDKISYKKLDSGKRFKSQELAHLEQNIMKNTQSKYKYDFTDSIQSTTINKVSNEYNETNAVTINKAPNEYDETNAITINKTSNEYDETNAVTINKTSNEYDEMNAVTINKASNEYDETNAVMCMLHKLVRKENYRFRDIALITSDFEAYSAVLEESLNKYNIPAFMSSPDDLSIRPLIRFISHLLNASMGSLDSVLTMLKCGVTDIKLDDSCIFDNYVYIWNLNMSSLFDKFTAHPRGFEEEWKDEDYQILQTANDIRERIVEVLSAIRAANMSEDAAAISQAIFNSLESLGIKTTLNEQIKECVLQNENVISEQIQRDWDILMEILSVLSVSLTEQKINLKEYYELFILTVKNKKVESVQKTMDCVTIGAADKIRTSNFKAVFILGVNEGLFPRFPGEYGAFSDNERKIFIDMDIHLAPLIEKQIISERFHAYTRLCSASEKLFLSYRCADVTGAEMYPSSVIEQIKNMFGIKIGDVENNLIELSQTKEAAFSALCRGFSEDNFEKQVLMEYFKEQDDYNDKIKRFKNDANSRNYKLTDKNSEAIFGKRMKLSPSAIEKYHTCPFAYFCSKGLKLYPKKRAEMNPLESGSLMHHVLHQLIADNPEFIQMSKDTLTEEIHKILTAYLEQKLSGDKYKTQRFLHLFGMMIRPLVLVALRLQKELTHTKFTPVEFEMELNQSDNSPPFVKTEKGTQVRLMGRVDRVDMMNFEDKKYLRVIDYKKGKKKFKVSDLYYGVNIQMLIYLYYLCNYDKGRYKGYLPAGVLYRPLKEMKPQNAREIGKDKLEKEQSKHYSPVGMVVSKPEILDAFKHEVKYLQNKLPYDEETLWSEEKTEEMFGFLKELTKNMAENLEQGEINATPLQIEYDPCQYCEYKEICGGKV